jgi:uncharacterized phage infection (PIP) family protein YhgE
MLKSKESTALKTFQRTLQSRDDYIRELEHQLHEAIEHPKETELNLDVMRENAFLRQDLEKVTHKLQSQMGKEYIEWSECLVLPATIETAAPGATKIPIHLLKETVTGPSGKPSAYSPTKVHIDQALQTDPDPSVTAHELRAMELESSLAEVNEALKNETQIKSSLGLALEQMQNETETLEQTFSKLSSDIEVSKAAERLSRKKVEDAKALIEQYSNQNATLAEQVKAAEKKLKQHFHAHSVIENMEKPTSTSVSEPVIEDIKDPVVIIEYKWRVDRERLRNEIAAQKQKNSEIKKEIVSLKAEYEDRVKEMYDSTEWALM